jgi:hypothetical protein
MNGVNTIGPSLIGAKLLSCITNDTKWVMIPKSFSINNQSINFFNKFRLLGVLVDNKLKLNAYVAQQYLAIKRRLFTIKNLFFLTIEVIIIFFV